MKTLKVASFLRVSIKYNSSSTSRIMRSSLLVESGINRKTVSAFTIVWSLMDNEARVKSFATSSKSGKACSLVGKIGID